MWSIHKKQRKNWKIYADRKYRFYLQNDLDKTFQHDAAYGKSKDLAKRTLSDNVLRDKAFEIESDPKYDGYQIGLASMVYKFLTNNLVEGVLLPSQITNWHMNFIGRLFENLGEEKLIYLLESIFKVLI